MTTRLSILGISGRPYGTFRVFGITAVVGSLAFSGPDVFLKAPRIEPTVGSYTFSGGDIQFGDIARITSLSILGLPHKPYIDADLLLTNTLFAATGNYTFSGPDVTFKANRLPAEVGSYTFSAPDVDLIYDNSEPANSWFNDSWWVSPTWGIDKWWGIPNVNIFSVDAGNYTFSGPDIDFNPPNRLVADAGNYTFSGPDLDGLRSSRRMLTEVGQYTFTGVDVVLGTFTNNGILEPTVGTYQFSGPDARLGVVLAINEAMLQRYSSFEQRTLYRLTNVKQLIASLGFGNPSAWIITPDKTNTGSATITNGKLILTDFIGTVTEATTNAQAGVEYNFIVTIPVWTPVIVGQTIQYGNLYATYGDTTFWGSPLGHDGTDNPVTGTVTTTSANGLSIVAATTINAEIDSISLEEA